MYKCLPISVPRNSGHPNNRKKQQQEAGYTDWRASRSRLCFKTKCTETLGLVSVTIQFWLLTSLGLGFVHLIIFPKVSGLVSSLNIVLISVLRLSVSLQIWFSKSLRLGLVRLLIFQEVSFSVSFQNICLADQWLVTPSKMIHWASDNPSWGFRF